MLNKIGLFWYDFIVGDDRTMAVGVVCATALTWFVVGTVAAAWVITPVAVAGLLALSFGRAQRAARVCGS